MEGGTMADIRRFRHEKRLKSLDECEGPILRFDPPRPKAISLPVIILAGLTLGVALGYLIFV